MAVAAPEKRHRTAPLYGAGGELFEVRGRASTPSAAGRTRSRRRRGALEALAKSVNDKVRARIWRSRSVEH